MEYLEDILVMVVAILGVLIVLVPVLGLTLRFVAKPLAEAFAQVRAGQGGGPALEAMERRLLALEEHVREMDGSVAQLRESVEFHRQLETPRGEARPDLTA